MGAFRPGAGHPHKRKELTPEEVEEVRKKGGGGVIFSPRRIPAIEGRKPFNQSYSTARQSWVPQLIIHGNKWPPTKRFIYT